MVAGLFVVLDATSPQVESFQGFVVSPWPGELSQQSEPGRVKVPLALTVVAFSAHGIQLFRTIAALESPLM